MFSFLTALLFNLICTTDMECEDSEIVPEYIMVGAFQTYEHARGLFVLEKTIIHKKAVALTQTQAMKEEKSKLYIFKFKGDNINCIKCNGILDKMQFYCILSEIDTLLYCIECYRKFVSYKGFEKLCYEIINLEGFGRFIIFIPIEILSSRFRIQINLENSQKEIFNIFLLHFENVDVNNNEYCIKLSKTDLLVSEKGKGLICLNGSLKKNGFFIYKNDFNMRYVGTIPILDFFEYYSRLINNNNFFINTIVIRIYYRTSIYRRIVIKNLNINFKSILLILKYVENENIIKGLRIGISSSLEENLVIQWNAISDNSNCTLLLKTKDFKKELVLAFLFLITIIENLQATYNNDNWNNIFNSYLKSDKNDYSSDKVKYLIYKYFLYGANISNLKYLYYLLNFTKDDGLYLNEELIEFIIENRKNVISYVLETYWKYYNPQTTH